MNGTGQGGVSADVQDASNMKHTEQLAEARPHDAQAFVGWSLQDRAVQQGSWRQSDEKVALYHLRLNLR